MVMCESGFSVFAVRVCVCVCGWMDGGVLVWVEVEYILPRSHASHVYTCETCIKRVGNVLNT